MKKKRKKRRKNRIFLWGCFFLLFLLSLCFFGIFYYQNYFQDKINPVDSKDIPKEEIYQLSMTMVGDNLIHDKIYMEAKTYAGGNGYDFTPILEFIKPMVQKYDLAYYNQETILGGSDIGVSSYPAFNSPYEVGDAMVDAGFNLVSLATNHTMDRGETAIINSRNYWDSFLTNSKEDILAVGSYISAESRSEIQIRKKNHITYTMLNYTYGINGIVIPGGKEYLVNVWPVTGSNPEEDLRYQEYKNQVKEDVEKVRQQVDVLIVAMHWGVEYQYTPNAYQKDMANFLASLGVDIIIGTHPHVIQPIEWISNTLVIYSLGNFLSAHEVVDLGNRIGLMSNIMITKNVDENDVEIHIDQLENELLYTYYTEDYHDFKVIPFHLLNETYLTNYKEVYDEYKNIVQSIDKNIKVVPLDA